MLAPEREHEPVVAVVAVAAAESAAVDGRVGAGRYNLGAPWNRASEEAFRKEWRW